MFIEYIKPIPKYILKEIEQADKNRYDTTNRTRYYAYLTIIKKEICKITVAVKNIKEKWCCKQVAVHYVPSDIAYTRNLKFYYICGYITEWDYDSNEWYTIEDKYADPYAPIINLEIIGKLDKYKYAAYQTYNDVDIIQYLRQYQKYPECEYLIKLGLQKYIHNTSILKLMQKDKNFIKYLVKLNQNKMLRKLDVPIIIKAYKTKDNAEKLQKIKNIKNELKTYRYSNIINDVWGEKLEQFQDYILNQNITIHDYLDYINACKYLQLDLTQNKNKQPKEFMRWHDIRIDQYNTKKAKEDKKKRIQLYKDFNKISQKYNKLSYTQNQDFICIIAKSPNELVNEGNILHHCVGRMNYDQKFIQEKSLIFFVRKKTEPTIPYVTMEFALQNKTITQCYAEHDSKPEDNVLNFVNNQWLKYAKQQLKQIAA